MKKFILHWGELGTRWGINRTVAQIHALLYLSPKALNAEEIAQTLSIARSNVSTSLKELQSWGVVKIVHEFGYRKDYFESEKYVCEMARTVPDERKKREIDPTLTVLRECVLDSGSKSDGDEYANRKLTEMLEYFEQITAWYDQISTMSTDNLRRLVKLGSGVKKVLGKVS
ncbi:MAG: MarR family transcriptional regulator [Candidatus Dadabacteria bacterium]|nr:MarR family transcriptional regulator [Candidatus Dadabacteria bacterium]NIS08928.1 MarR family transcriptional regulator [Candidatus Dadabacteria bacterium]NIV40830.1 MarR family transcriptional regulator [Candidatus Dadabacteria bacterium]NIX15478.1 MarR family transcriptional regulator [Candidatus Dadabacteria bacterium]NIY22799.1 MarR family transcriptional regulator [Candidatus Dadabacteria bacterium]